MESYAINFLKNWSNRLCNVLSHLKSRMASQQPGKMKDDYGVIQDKPILYSFQLAIADCNELQVIPDRSQPQSVQCLGKKLRSRDSQSQMLPASLKQLLCFAAGMAKKLKGSGRHQKGLR